MNLAGKKKVKLRIVKYVKMIEIYEIHLIYLIKNVLFIYFKRSLSSFTIFVKKIIA